MIDFIFHLFIMGTMTGEHLRRERKRRGLSLQDVAEKAGVSPATVQRVELGQVQPRVDTLYKLESALGLRRASSVSSTKTSDEVPLDSSRTSLRRARAFIDDVEWLPEESKQYLKKYLTDKWQQYSQWKKTQK